MRHVRLILFPGLCVCVLGCSKMPFIMPYMAERQYTALARARTICIVADSPPAFVTCPLEALLGADDCATSLPFKEDAEAIVEYAGMRVVQDPDEADVVLRVSAVFRSLSASYESPGRGIKNFTTGGVVSGWVKIGTRHEAGTEFRDQYELFHQGLKGTSDVVSWSHASGTHLLSRDSIMRWAYLKSTYLSQLLTVLFHTRGMNVIRLSLESERPSIRGGAVTALDDTLLWSKHENEARELLERALDDQNTNVRERAEVVRAVRAGSGLWPLPIHLR